MTKDSKALTNPKELLKKQLAEQNERIAQSDSVRIKMSVRNGFQAPGEEGSGDQLDVIVVDYTLVHAFYLTAYDKDNIVPPDCYANNRLFADLKPIPSSPSKQAIACAVCPQNKFGSHPNGSAKACRNSRLLAVLPYDDPAHAPVWTLSVPPTATKRWDKYVRDLSKMGLTPLFVRTAITLTPDIDFISPVFNLVEPLDDKAANAAISRLQEAAGILDRVPTWEDDGKEKDFEDDIPY